MPYNFELGNTQVVVGRKMSDTPMATLDSSFYPPTPHACAYWSGDAWLLPSAHPRGDHIPMDGEGPHFVCFLCTAVGHTKDFCMGAWACRACGQFFLEGDHTVKDEHVRFGERHSTCFDHWSTCRVCHYPSFVDPGGTHFPLIFDHLNPSLPGHTSSPSLPGHTSPRSLPGHAWLPRHEACVDPFALASSGISQSKPGLLKLDGKDRDLIKGSKKKPRGQKKNQRPKKPHKHRHRDEDCHPDEEFSKDKQDQEETRLLLLQQRREAQKAFLPAFHSMQDFPLLS